MRKYLHDYEKNYEREKVLLEQSPISDCSKQLIRDFRDYNSVNDISIPRLLRQASVLRLVDTWLKKDLDKVTAKDLELFFISMRERNYAAESITTYKEIVKVFYKWMNKGVYPECVSWIKVGSKKKNNKLPDQLLIQEDVKKLLLAAFNPRDKALIAVLWESGARIGEVGGLQIKNIAFDDFGCQAMLDGKTGMRRIRLVNSAPALLEWLNKHPDNQNPEAPVWVNIDQNRGQQMIYEYIHKLLFQIGRRAGIKKPMNPHHFRHSRATYLSQFLTEAQMKEYFGWTQDSTMASRYIHLSGKQVDDAILQLNGLKKPERKEEILKREACPRCKNLNDINNQFCEKCWLPLTPNATIETQTVEQKSQESAVSLMKLIELVGNNPEMLKQALTVIQQQAAGR